MAACALGKNFEDQQRPVVDRQAQMAFQIALLRRTQRLVEQDLGGARRLGQHFDLVGLAGPHKQGRIGRAPFAGDTVGHPIASRLRQQAKLFERNVKMGQPEIHAHQNDRWRGVAGRIRRVQISSTGLQRCRQPRSRGCPVACRIQGVNQEAADSSAPAAENCTGRPGTMVEMACL